MQDWVNFRIYEARPKAAQRLFLFHHAGASSISYRAFAKSISPDVEVVVAELPGRASRAQEKFSTSIHSFLHSAKKEFIHLSAKPFWIFGHSMGALFAYEAALMLQDAGYSPEGVIVSGLGSPKCTLPLKSVRGKSSGEILSIMEAFGALPKGLLNNTEAAEYFANILKHDLIIMEEYQQDKEISRLTCPLVALGGLEDKLVQQRELEAWNSCTREAVKIKQFPGGHFYLLENSNPVAKYLDSLIAQSWSF